MNIRVIRVYRDSLVLELLRFLGLLVLLRLSGLLGSIGHKG
jgi:hypothetical protein